MTKDEREFVWALVEEFYQTHPVDTGCTITFVINKDGSLDLDAVRVKEPKEDA